MKRFWRLLALCVLLLLVLPVILLFSASSWLETTAGRNLLQQELGKSLNLSARLEGDYQLKLFPRLQISGQRLLLQDAAAMHLLAEMNSYELLLAVWPLFRKQVIIPKISVHDGSLYLDELTRLVQSIPADDTSAMQSPEIQAMEITGLNLFQSGEELLRVNQLGLQDFKAGHDSPFSLDLELPENNAKLFGIKLKGWLNLRATPFEAILDATQWTLEQNRVSWLSGTGRVTSLAERSEFAGQLHGALGGYDGQMDFLLQTADQLRLQLTLGLQSADTGPLTARLTASDHFGDWQLDPLEVNLNGQILQGEGCLRLVDETSLQLELRADHLDIDALSKLLPANLLGADTENPSIKAELPLQLALAIQADEVLLGGAVARDLRLLVGQEPDCELVSVHKRQFLDGH